MKPDNLELIYFSPTGTTQTILRAIAAGIGHSSLNEINLTLPNEPDYSIESTNRDLALIGVPVYAGRVPLTAVERIKKMSVSGIPAVIVVLYGNREFEDALVELNDLVLEQGFIPIAGGAFIGEHSYSTSAKPIAENRPDGADLEKAKSFGEAIIGRLESLNEIKHGQLVIPGDRPYKERRVISGMPPKPLEGECMECLECASACPTAAIEMNSPKDVNAELCIVCCACVKTCPSGARVIQHPQFEQISDWLFTNFSQRKEPELFL